MGSWWRHDVPVDVCVRLILLFNSVQSIFYDNKSFFLNKKHTLFFPFVFSHMLVEFIPMFYFTIPHVYKMND